MDRIGSFLSELACAERRHTSAPCHRIERTSTAILVTVSNASEELTHTIDLATHHPPAAVPIEIAEAILACPAQQATPASSALARIRRMAARVHSFTRPR
ncbi:MAG: hypothetical protein QJR09_14295 [Micrococcus sp.]|nr:hypothetical protein [Micrococcus sp.]